MGKSTDGEMVTVPENQATVAGGSADGRMRILFATDGSEAAGAALTFLQQLVSPAQTVVHVVCIIPVRISPYDEGGAFIDWEAVIRQARPGVENTVREASAALADKGFEVSSVIKDGEPAGEILHAAREWGADLVVVGSKGLSGVRGFFLGSVARDVTRHCPYPVLVAHSPKDELCRVVVATDGSEHARRAVAFASRLPLTSEGVFTVLHVVRPYRWFTAPSGLRHEPAAEELRQKQHALAVRITTDAEQSLKQTGRPVQAEIREGDPAAEIHQLAEESGADLIVAGARGVSLVRGLLTGSVADRLLTEARSSVLIVP